MDGAFMVAAGTAAYCVWGYAEAWLHQRRLNRIPIRIHVNGTRGKSAVTRLIASGLRAGGLRTFAKTTGTLARAIFPDGSEYPVFRPARANVIEQIRMARLAASEQVDALVIECMALHPALQSLCELKLVQSTHGVITNARADHLDVMGPTAAHVAKALAATVPVNGKVFTAEQPHLAAFQAAATDRMSRLFAIGDDEVARVSWDELEKFSYVEHPDNVALALRVCESVGVDRQTALSGMWSATPDPGAMRLLRISEGARRIMFVNGFAANDPQSTGQIWNMMVARHAECKQRIAVVNCRADRQDRSVQLAQAVSTWKPADHYVLVGSQTETFRRVARSGGVPNHALVGMEDHPVSDVARTISQRSGASAMVMGMGNTAGPGMALVDYFERRGTHSGRQVRSETGTLAPREAA